MLLIASLVLAKPKPKPSEAPPAPAADPNAAPIPPKDAQYTLYCQAVAGSDHVERANQFKNQLLQSTPLKDWYVIHQETDSVLYYGFYRSIASAERTAPCSNGMRGIQPRARIFEQSRAYRRSWPGRS